MMNLLAIQVLAKKAKKTIVFKEVDGWLEKE